MVKKIFTIGLIMTFCIALATAVLAEVIKKPAPMSQPKAMTRPMRPAIGMMSGTISKIDNADPANVKVEIKSDKDDSVHTLMVMPWTNITKVTDLSELKIGEPVRVISRKIDDKDAAMGIIFGNLKNITGPGPMAPVTPVKKVIAPVTQGTVKK